MSRHRNVRQMNYDEEYDDYYTDMAGSVEDESGFSPSSVEKEFMYDRSRQLHSMASFIQSDVDTPSGDQPAGDSRRVSLDRRDSTEPAIPRHITGAELRRLTSCLDQIRDVVGDTVAEHQMVDAIIRSGFVVERALDTVLSSAAAGMSVSDSPVVNKSLPDSSDGPSFAPAVTSSTVAASANPPVPSFTAASDVGGKLSRVEASGAGAMPTPSVHQRFSGAVKSDRLAVEELRVETRSRPHTPSVPAQSRPAAAAEDSTPQRPARIRDVRAEYMKERKDGKPQVNMVVIGHVDAGKSTLMGHLLYQLGFVNQKAMHKFETESKKIGKQSFKYAWVLDETGEERNRGITMDVAHFRFETANKCITLLDAPGHKDFIPNMITGASVADAAVLVVNATNGEFETGFELGGQTREHAILVRSLGVTQMAIAVNKLDTVQWSGVRFDEIRGRLGAFLKSIGFREADLRYVPCSGLTGGNLTVVPSDNPSLVDWYSGPTLLQVIDEFSAPERLLDLPLRLTVSDVFKGLQQAGLSVAGRVDAGMLQPGDRVTLMPANETVTVKSLSIEDMPVSSAFAGDHVTLTLQNADAQLLATGVVVCDPTHPVPVTSRVQARIVVFDIELPITKGYPVEVHFQSVSEPAVVSRLLQQLQRSTGQPLGRRRPRCLCGNISADVQLTFLRPVCLERYRDFRQYGRLMLRAGGHTIAAGLVTEIK